MKINKGFAVAAALIAVVALGYKMHKTDKLPAATASQAPNGLYKSSNPRQQSNANQPNPEDRETARQANEPDAVRPLSYHTAVSIQQEIPKAHMANGDKAYFLESIGAACPPEYLLRRPKNPTASQQYYRSYMSNFCRGSSEIESGKLVGALPKSDPVAIAYRSSNTAFQANTSALERAAAISRLDALANSRSGAASLIAAEALQQVGYVSPRTQAIANRLGLARSLDQSELLQAQVYSAKINVCERYGGCGPGEWQSILGCNLQKSCSQFTTVENTWRETSSSATIQLAQALSSN